MKLRRRSRYQHEAKVRGEHRQPEPGAGAAEKREQHVEQFQGERAQGHELGARAPSPCRRSRTD